MTIDSAAEPAPAAGQQADKVAPEFEAEFDGDSFSQLLSRLREAPALSLPLLHFSQNHRFWIVDNSGIDSITARLELRRFNVCELVTFYPWFRRGPARKTILRVCHTLACAIAGPAPL